MEWNKNLSIQVFELFNDPDKQNLAWPNMSKELWINAFNAQTYFTFLEKGSNDWFDTKVQHIKLCLKFYLRIIFDSKIQDEELQSLEYYLRLSDHKIAALDMSSKLFKQDEINKVIKVLSKPDIDNFKLDVINLGSRKIHEKDLIFLGKYLLK